MLVAHKILEGKMNIPGQSVMKKANLVEPKKVELLTGFYSLNSTLGVESKSRQLSYGAKVSVIFSRFSTFINGCIFL